MSKTQLILVTGATGQQGGAVARSLLRRGQKVRALTRNPAKAAWLVREGVEVARGDLTDSASLRAALQEVQGVFAMSTPFEAGMDEEVAQGTMLADLAKQAGVQHYVYTSVGGAERNTGIPHFDTKWQVEQHIRKIGLPATILRPVWFMENFGTFCRPFILQGTLALPLRPDRKLQMIALQDIGEFGASAFVRPDDFLGQAIELAGDELTMTEVVAHLSRTMGRPIRFQQVPDDQAPAAFGDDLAVMFRWFNEQGYQGDSEGLERRYGIPLTKFTEVIASADWARE